MKWSPVILLLVLTSACESALPDEQVAEVEGEDAGVTCPIPDVSAPSSSFLTEECSSRTAPLPTHLCGSCEVLNVETLEALQRVEVIEGDLRISIAGQQVPVILPRLRRVGGVSARGGSITEITLPALEVASSFRISQVPLLTKIEADLLGNLLGRLQLENLDTLRSVSFQSLEHTNGLSLESCPNLESVDFAQLSSTEFDVAIVRAGLQVVEFPSLQSARAITLAGNQHASVSMPALLRVERASIRSNRELSTLNLERLSAIESSLEIVRNPDLPSDSICQILMQLEDEGGVPPQLDVESIPCELFE